jgi:ATP sulfurylase
VNAVLDHNRLTDGAAWTMPLVLQIGNDREVNFSAGDRIRLENGGGDGRAILDVSEIYQMDLESVARKWFGTSSTRHPGVARFYDGGNTFVAGAVSGVPGGPAAGGPFELTPHQTRFIFRQKGWIQVVGFHSRNVCHRVHEHIQIHALERTGADGLYISPVVGPKKPGDFLSEPILESYQLLIQSGRYPRGQVVLGSFSTYSRYCGPREAVFTAICRKNMGCSHFIIGRDHAGVGDFYPADANQKIFDELGDIGVTPLFFGNIGYNPQSECFEEVHGGDHVEQISGTLVRKTLNAGERLPGWVMRDEIQDMLLAEITAGRALFHP